MERKNGQIKEMISMQMLVFLHNTTSGIQCLY